MGLDGIRPVSKITLDAETFKALASATRLTVLKALDERRKTLTELAHELSLNKATVHEHLGLLLAAGLIRKRDEGRKWIYYELTWTGQGILRPEATTTFNVLLGLSTLAAGGGVFMLGRALDWWLSSKGATSRESDFGAGDDSTRAFNSPESASEPAGASGTTTATGTGAAGASPEQADQTFALEAPPEPDGGGGQPFLDDGGWIALALLAAFAVICVLAWFLRSRSPAKPFDPEAAARAEAAPPPA